MNVWIGSKAECHGPTGECIPQQRAWKTHVRNLARKGTQRTAAAKVLKGVPKTKEKDQTYKTDQTDKRDTTDKIDKIDKTDKTDKRDKRDQKETKITVEEKEITVPWKANLCPPHGMVYACPKSKSPT